MDQALRQRMSIYRHAEFILGMWLESFEDPE